MNWDDHLRLRHVRTFLEIARFESVSQASDALHISQPAVSRSLKELEALCGTPLFDRVGRGIRLNAAGRMFQAHASAAMTELLRGKDRVASEGAKSTRLSIGALPTAATELVPQAALSFAAEAPHAQLNIMTGPNWLLFNQLRDGQLDLVVGRMPENDDKAGLLFEQLYLETVVLVCRPGHPIQKARNKEAALADYPLILPPKGAVIASTVGRYLASLGLAEMRGAVETVALPIGRRIVQLSDALWFISRGVVADELAAGRLLAVDLTSPLLSGPVGISQLQAAPVSVERHLFVACLRKAQRQ